MRMFWIVAAALLAWSLIGDAAYLMQVSADPDALARTDPVTAEAFRSMPWWAWSAYAIAVWVGTAGAIALLLRRRIATVLFGISLAGVIVQFGWSFLGFGMIGHKGISAVVFPLVIAVVALAAMLYSRAKERDGTLH